jgi:NH3-dependent NAD+ synthetase
MKRASVYRYASGQNELKLDDISRICKKLKISIGYDDISSHVENYLHLIHEMNDKKNNDKQKYFNISSIMRNILEFEKKHPSLLDIPSSDLIIDKK